MTPDVKDDDWNLDCEIEPRMVEDLVRQALVYSLDDPNSGVRRDAHRGLLRLRARQMISGRGAMMPSDN